MSLGNEDIEKDLAELPDIVAAALTKWRIATLNRQKTEALLFAAIKGQDEDISTTEIKARIQADPNRYQAVLDEIQAEAAYTSLYERLLSAKKRASLRTAF